MIKVTGSETLQTSALNEQVLQNGELLSFFSMVNIVGDMTLTVNEGDPIFVPEGFGFTTADMSNLTMIKDRKSVV